MTDNKSLELAMAQLDRQFGAGTVMKLGSAEVKPCPSVPTGAFSLDLDLGIGGLPLGKIIEIYGMESSGKSTVCLSLVAEAQKMGLKCLYIDAEHALDPIYMQALGVDMDDLLLSQPDYGEQALEVVDKLIRTGELGVVIIDSVAALVPKAELDGEMEQAHMGLQARMMAKALRKLTPLASEHGTMIVFINQIRNKIGVMFGNPETTTGGMSLKFYASVRIDLRKKEDLKNKNGESVGIKVKAKIIKNKVSPPMRVSEFDIYYGKGVDNIGSLVDLAIQTGIFTQKGAWVYYEGESFSQGKENAKDKLKSDLELASKIKHQIESLIDDRKIKEFMEDGIRTDTVS